MFSKIGAYLKGAQQELKHVQWPTAQVTRSLTLIVIGFSLIAAVYLGAFDYLYQYILQTVINL